MMGVPRGNGIEPRVKGESGRLNKIGDGDGGGDGDGESVGDWKGDGTSKEDEGGGGKGLLGMILRGEIGGEERTGTPRGRGSEEGSEKISSAKRGGKPRTIGIFLLEEGF